MCFGQRYIAFCCFIGDVCDCGETNAVTADVCAQNLFGVDVLGPCMAKVESALMSYSTTVLLSASQSASETVALLPPPPVLVLWVVHPLFG